MEWTAQTIREVEFREKLRGYHPDDVDAFVEQVAAAFEQQQAGLVGAVAAPAEQSVSEETIRKTLLMAQRTADLVLSEAEEAATRLRDEARAEADALIAEATRSADELHDAARERAHTNLAQLELARSQLEQEVAQLRDYVESQRRRLRDALTEQLELLDRHEPLLESAPAFEESSADDVRPAEVIDIDHPAEPEIDVLSRAHHLPGEGEDDPFLTELRRAIDEREDPETPPQPGPTGQLYDALGTEGGRLGARLFRRR